VYVVQRKAAGVAGDGKPLGECSKAELIALVEQQTNEHKKKYGRACRSPVCAPTPTTPTAQLTIQAIALTIFGLVLRAPPSS
jgi:hypothetical protein